MDLGFRGVVSLEVVESGFLSGTQPHRTWGPSTAHATTMYKTQRPGDSTGPGAAREWRHLVKRSAKCGDYSEKEEPWKWSELKHAAKGRFLSIDDRYEPTGLQAKLKSLKDVKAGNGQEPKAPGPVEVDDGQSGGRSSTERLWQKYFRDPTAWWDNRKDKLHLKSPDFRHKVTNEALWIYKPSTPKWVTQVLESRLSSNEADGGCIRFFSSSDSVSELDEFSWTALLSQHIQCGQHRQALQTYEEMLESGIQPSSYTFVTALKACTSLQDLESAKHIHADVIRSGFESSVFVGNMLVNVYAKCGHVAGARHVFEEIPQRNVVSWNTMILAYTNIEQADEALQLYKRMQQEGVAPDGRTFVAVLKCCSSLSVMEQEDKAGITARWLEQVRVIHSDMLKLGPVLDIYVGNMLVYVYAKCGSLPDSRCVFDNMPRHNVVSWTAMIMGYVQMEEGEVALQLYAQMQQEGVRPNARTFVGALKALSSLASSEKSSEETILVLNTRCMEQVRVIHRDIVNSGFEPDVFVATMLLVVYAKCGSLLDARYVFDNMPHRNVVSWTAMILVCAQMEKGEEALLLYAQMQQEGVVPNDRTFVGALKACSSLASSHEWNKGGGILRRWCMEHVRGIHSEVIKSGSYSDVFVGTMLVDVYAKCGSLVDARIVFEKMPHHDAVSWNAMILGYSQMDEGEAALQLYARMQQEGVVPDERTFMGALKACGSVAGLEKGKGIHAQISKTGLAVTDSFVASSLIDMYAKCGSMGEAQNVFDALRKKDIVTWSALIAGYARQGESALVFDLFERMRTQGIIPNGVTFLSLLSVCSHVGLVDKGQKYFESMSRDYGITPSINHYTSMIDLLGRVGYLDKAMDVVKSMPFAPDGAVWEALLGAFRKWENVDLEGRHLNVP